MTTGTRISYDFNRDRRFYPMKVETIYVCEKCDTSYNTAEEATACEEKHLTPEVVIPDKYTVTDIYPRRVRVKFSDGRLIGYSR